MDPVEIDAATLIRLLEQRVGELTSQVMQQQLINAELTRRLTEANPKGKP